MPDVLPPHAQECEMVICKDDDGLQRMVNRPTLLLGDAAREWRVAASNLTYRENTYPSQVAGATRVDLRLESRVDLDGYGTVGWRKWGK